MNLLLALLFVAPLSALTFALGMAVQVSLFPLVLAIFISGGIVNRIARVDEPFLEFIVGFAVLSHVLMAYQYFAPFGLWPLFVAMILLIVATHKSYKPTPYSRDALLIGLFIALFTYLWCRDLTPRLNEFETTGKLEFWPDILLHAGTIAQFSVDSSVGRGMVWMADVPLPLYHVASYMPAALIARMTNIPTIDATVFVWIPIGVLTMAIGIVALGFALGGKRLALAALAAVALVPNPEQLLLKNGFLGFSWLLDTAPGTPYGLGIACGAIAMLVYWIRNGRPTTLVLVALLGAACLLVRANIFIWLAPTLVLSVVVGIRKLSKVQRFLTIVTGLAMLCAFLIIISWEHIHADPANFLFSYIEFVHLNQPPTNYQGLYPRLMAAMGRGGAATFGVGLVLLGTLGPWLPIFALSSLALVGRKKFAAHDVIPFILLAVAAIMMILAPIPSNSDITEFRHRAGPILVLVISVWSIRFVALMSASLFSVGIEKNTWRLLIVASAASILAMTVNISWARYPRMSWATNFYGSQLSPGLFALASVLSSDPGKLPRFVVANQSGASRNRDDASALVALSGVPAYISRPQSMLLRHDDVGDEARRRMNVVKRLSEAPSLAALRDIMTSERITQYVVTNPQQVVFDPERNGAAWRSGQYAIYRVR